MDPLLGEGANANSDSVSGVVGYRKKNQRAKRDAPELLVVFKLVA